MRFLVGFLVFVLPTLAAAQDGVIVEGLEGCDFTTGKPMAACVPVFIGHLVRIIMSLVGSVFTINVMIGGYQYAMGTIQGDEGKGKERIYWSIIGLIVTACSYLILDLVLTALFTTA